VTPLSYLCCSRPKIHIRSCPVITPDKPRCFAASTYGLRRTSQIRKLTCCSRATGLAAGFGFQTAVTSYHTYNHNLIFTRPQSLLR
jgi:hypothetical protein